MASGRLVVLGVGELVYFFVDNSRWYGMMQSNRGDIESITPFWWLTAPFFDNLNNARHHGIATVGTWHWFDVLRCLAGREQASKRVVGFVEPWQAEE